MKAMGFASRIGAALDLDRPDESVDRVKAAVIAELQALDPQLHIKSTDYFNHSYVPDLVASWPQHSGAGERYIYLKFNGQLDYLFEDIELVKDNQPIIFGLESTPKADDTERQRLTDTSHETNTLLTDADGVEALISQRSNRFFELVASALAQGGRGLLDEPAAIETARSLNTGFEGARRTELGSTRRAADILDTYLDRPFASPMIGLLQAIWLGSGGSIENFPGRQDLVSGIADNALQFLLELDPIDDSDFWARLARRVPFDQLVRLDLPAGSVNLDRLMRVAAKSYGARYCRVRSEQRTLFDADRPPAFWFVDRRLLGVKGFGFAAYVSDHIANLKPVAAQRGRAIPLPVLLGKVAEGASLTELELSVGKRAIRYSSRDQSDITQDDTLDQLARSLNRAPAVLSAAITMHNNERLHCDFITKTARGQIHVLFPVPELIWTVVPLFDDMAPDELTELRNLLPEDVFEASEMLHGQTREPAEAAADDGDEWVDG